MYVYVGAKFMMEDGEISDNIATGNGGGVELMYGTFTMENGEICRNTANFGGGAYLYAATFTMNNGTITDNTATNSYSKNGVYGDIFIHNGGTVQED